MARKVTLSGTWREGSNVVSCKIPLIVFKEDETFVVYCPALDLNGSGNTEAEARNSFSISLSEYFKYTTHKKTLAEDLAKHGWKIKKSKRNWAIPPSMVQILKTNDDFNRIFNNYDYKKTDTTVEIPCAV